MQEKINTNERIKDKSWLFGKDKKNRQDFEKVKKKEKIRNIRIKKYLTIDTSEM